MSRVALALATGLGSGLSPVAPGTAGSLLGLAVWWGVRSSGAPAVELAALLGCLLVGAWAAGVAERHYGRRDPGQVVIDEVFGMLLTLAWLPLSWAGMAVGFVLFRVFDILKPAPARALERLPGGWGVMADDGMAAVYAHVVLRVAGWLWPAWMMSA